jgi:hypothetical protein
MSLTYFPTYLPMHINVTHGTGSERLPPSCGGMLQKSYAGAALCCGPGSNIPFKKNAIVIAAGTYTSVIQFFSKKHHTPVPIFFKTQLF